MVYRESSLQIQGRGAGTLSQPHLQELGSDACWVLREISLCFPSPQILLAHGLGLPPLWNAAPLECHMEFWASLITLASSLGASGG